MTVWFLLQKLVNHYNDLYINTVDPLLPLTTPTTDTTYGLLNNLSEYRFIVFIGCWDNSQLKTFYTIPVNLFERYKGGCIVVTDGTNLINVRYVSDSEIKLEKSSDTVYWGIRIFGIK